MAENVTPVVLKIKDFAPREVLLVNYKFNQEFENTKDGSAMKTLKGTACYCTHYKEYWADGEEHYEEILLSCQKLENGSVSYENPWN